MEEKTIINQRGSCRFLRTFAPFVAGIGRMTYLRFFAYNLAGAACLGAVACLYAGYWFGKRPRGQAET